MVFAITILENTLGLWLAVWLLPQYFPNSIEWTGEGYELVIAGLVLGVINALMKPLVKLLSFPLLILTAGLFGIVINLGMLWFLDLLLPQLTINGILPLVLTSLMLGVVHFLI
ncbi:MAG: hypothetical protein A2806_02230 [Candidatus Terrybacteria bacterium RIFCSPHIGHO2_01_FULL_48_17]|uniref:Phage holin family protein n=1 Tax=Candidatus Terrybacteria bacterium RIFCSPHIGHO2_01_FULL_48_17 TaxID=1802362 RepID=A0A1G2PJ86_9BACT|nr:MAG: hypothetical protein A2806_02230 [Candidatus Terrybacteria bacterium RIFCSPHIGHO2_01_FULL_48_17]OHA53565.1 MAG: hypothetical protein A3A30_00185 [Candidatus Terrybacteria bacterium RIFCSPLOWO2_01_FULL_48_14]